MDFAVQPISFNELNSANDPAGRSISALGHHKFGSSSTAAAQANQPVQPTQDTVKLSVSSQIQALKQKGASTVEIATRLGLSISDVDQMLHVTATVAATQATSSAALSVRH